MERWSAVLLSLLFCMCAACPCRAGAPGAGTSPYADFERRLGEIRSLLHVPGVAAAITAGDRIVWSTTLGEADMAQHTAVTSATRFPIASITKTMTAAMLMQLVAENRLSLDTPMAVANPESTLPPSVRIAHVLSHTSELGPGEEYLYNGSRFNTLTAVVERTGGEPLAVALKHRVFERAGMRQAVVAMTAPERDAANLAQPYDFDAAGPNAIKPGFKAPLGVRAASGVLATIGDLAHYAIALDQGRLLNAAQVATMTAPPRSSRGVMMPYALGWFVQEYRGEPMRWHYGQEDSYASLLVWLPRRHLSLVLLSNSSAMNDAARLLDGNLSRSLVAQAFFSTVAHLTDAPGVSRDVWIAEALAELYVGHKDRASALAQQAFAAPLDPLAQADLPAAFLLVNLNDPALDSATRAVAAAVLRDHPTLPPALYFAAMVKIRSGDPDGAIALLSRVAALPSPPRQWSVIQCLTELGALQVTRDPAAARITLQRVVDMNLNFGGAVNRAKQLLAALPPAATTPPP